MKLGDILQIFFDIYNWIKNFFSNIWKEIWCWANNKNIEDCE